MPPKELWEQLPEKLQYQTAHAVATRRTRDLRKQYPNVLSMGVGKRLRGDTRLGKEAYTLRFLVARKWKDKKNRPGKIPDFIAAYTQVRGRRVKVHIPTDVEALESGEQQNLEKGFIAAHRANNLPQMIDPCKGAACAMVRDENGRLFLLGCHHVFIRSTFSATLAPYEGPTYIYHNIGGEPHVGKTVAHKSLYSNIAQGGSTYAMDAALVEIEHKDGLKNAYYQNARPISVYAPSVQPPKYAWMHSPNGLYEVEIEGEFSQVPLKYYALPPGSSQRIWHTVWFYRLLRYRRIQRVGGTVQPLRTQNGDSGSSVMDANGKLLGMHIYADNAGNAYAIPGYALMKPKLFGRELRFV